MKVGISYTEFLAEENRKEEAQMVICGIWARVENHDSRGPIQNDLLKDLAILARQNGLSILAMTVMNRVNVHFKTHNVDNEDSRHIEGLLSELTCELLDNLDSEDDPKSLEEILMQTFESAKLGGPPAFTPSVLTMIQTLLAKCWKSVGRKWWKLLQPL